MVNLEGSTGPRRVVQSLWSGAAAAVHRLACPRPVSGRGEGHDRVAVVCVVVIQAVVIEMRRAPAGGRSERRARRNVDTVLRALVDDKTVGTRRISVRPRTATHTPGTRR